MNREQIIKIYKALGNENRLKIYEDLILSGVSKMSDLIEYTGGHTPKNQVRISRDIKILNNCGLINTYMVGNYL